MPLYTWSLTPGTNGTADPTINFSEGQAPSTLNDSGRALMTAVTKWRLDNEGNLSTSGTSTAYTVTTNSSFDSLAHLGQNRLTIFLHATCGAAPTLNVDGLGDRPIVYDTSLNAPAAGDLIGGTAYDFIYSPAYAAFFVCGITLAARSPVIPSGTLMLFQQTAAPTGWTKQTTHNDKALRVVSGSASSGGSTAFSTIMAARTLAQNQLPAVTLGYGGATGSGGGDASASPTTTMQVAAVTNTGASLYTLGSNGSLSTLTASRNQAGQTSPLNGTGAQATIDFAVAYVDLIIASKD